jgi:hypothetical protein
MASNEQQQAAITTLFAAHKRRYDSRRIVKALRVKGQKIGRYFVCNTLFNNELQDN